MKDATVNMYCTYAYYIMKSRTRSKPYIYTYLDICCSCFMPLCLSVLLEAINELIENKIVQQVNNNICPLGHIITVSATPRKAIAIIELDFTTCLS